MQGVKAQGKTIVLTPHCMEEAYLMCDEIIIVDHGRIIANGSPAALLAQHFDDSVLELPLAELDKLQEVVAYKRKGDLAERFIRRTLRARSAGCWQRAYRWRICASASARWRICFSS